MAGNWFPKGQYDGDLLDRFKFMRGHDWQRSNQEVVRLWHTFACMNCLTPIAMNIRYVHCEDDKYPRMAGLNEWKGALPQDGYSTYAGGPFYCGKCLQIWRDPTKAEHAQEDACHG